MIVNPARPSNPFGLTSEPDWVVVGRPQETGSPASRSSPRPVTLPRTKTKSTSSLDGQQKSHGMTPVLTISNNIPTSTTVTSPLSPSVASDVKRKPAPPIPKKPALLSTSSIGAERPNNRTVGESKTAIPNSSNDGERWNIGNPKSTLPPAPPPSQRPDSDIPSSRTGLGPSTANEHSAVRCTSEQQRLGSIPRSPATAWKTEKKNGTSRRDLLDDENEGARAIPSLQPSRPN